MSALIRPEDEVLIEAPNYESIYRIPLRLGAVVKTIDRVFEKGFQLDLEELQRRISKNTRVLILTNMHNPTGVLTNSDRMEAICQIARDYRAYVVSIEVYLDTAFDVNARPAVMCGDNAISINSFSKVYGLEGLRLGWVVTNVEKLMDKIQVICDDYLGFDVPTPSEHIGYLALKQSQKIIDRAKMIIRKNMQIVSDWIKKNEGTAWIEPNGATVCFVKLPHNIDSLLLSGYLRDKYSTLVVPGDLFWKKGFIRLSLGCKPEILEEGLLNLAKAIHEQE